MKITSAARLALRVGAQGSGHGRLLRLLRENSDLAGTFLDPQTVEDLVATRDLVGGWPNSNLLHEGALLSFAPSQQDYARSRLRSAIEWTVAGVNAPRGERETNGVTADDIAEIAIGLLNVDGAAIAVEFLQRWRPPHLAVKPAALIAARLAQQGRDEEIRDLLQAEHASEYVLLGVASSAAPTRHGSQDATSATPSTAAPSPRTGRRPRRRRRRTQARYHARFTFKTAAIHS